MMLKRNVLLFLAFFICVNVGNSRRSSKKRQHVDQTCTYEQRIDVAIEFEESTKRGAKLLDAVTKDNLDSCQENCCQLDGCTLALFHLTNASENCYLIRCHPIEVCSYTDLESFSVSVVSTDDGQIDTDIDVSSSTVRSPNYDLELIMKDEGLVGQF
ncbi:uncharacterized protein [Antedon mediterranea]|uniref:uncharacterized protein n=1 Tax=Antedon mediterranea TaxID=105859 RepID=UPI003AF97172